MGGYILVCLKQLVLSNAELILGKIRRLSRCPHYHMPGNKFLPLSSMVLRTSQAWSDAYRRDNHPIASRGKAVSNNVSLVN